MFKKNIIIITTAYFFSLPAAYAASVQPSGAPKSYSYKNSQQNSAEFLHQEELRKQRNLKQYQDYKNHRENYKEQDDSQHIVPEKLPESQDARKTKFALEAEYAYRTDTLNWNIASDITGNETPNILSELTWSNLKIHQAKVAAKIPLLSLSKTYGDVFASGYFSQGRIVSGDNQDSDYLGDDRTREFSRSNNDAGAGSVEDYSYALNYRVSIIDPDFYIRPNIGYSQHSQNLIMTKGRQTIPNSGTFGGLNSTYDAQWKGLFYGLTFEFYSTDQHHFEIGGEYHEIDYYAQANWNLRTDFQHPKSYEHKATGSGGVMSFRYKYQPEKNLYYTLGADYRSFVTNPGIGRTFFSNGTIEETRLNKVEWTSKSFMAGIGYDF